MKTINSSTLAGLTINMLERTAMLLAELASEDEKHPPATRFASINYRGPSHGTLVLGATDGFLREFAASLLGVEPPEVNIDTHGTDALKEMANIVGGSIILALSGETCEYSLGLPQLLPNAPANDSTTTGASCTVVAEGGSLRVYWQSATNAKAA